MCKQIMDLTELQSKTISFLRFPLIVLVVIAHSYFRGSQLSVFDSGSIPLYENVSYLLSSILGKIATPLFFFISGFLFFYKKDTFTFSTYKEKIKKRIRGIFVPYVLWNLLVIAYYFVLQTFRLGEGALSEKFITAYTISDWIYAFWNTYMINPLSTPTFDDAVAYPMCYQFWFLRDLMVLSIFSPIVYFIIKKGGLYTIITLCVLWIMNWWVHVTGFSIISIFFFSAGAYFSIHKKNFVQVFKPHLIKIGIVYVILIISMMCLKDYHISIYLARINRIIGAMFAIALSAHFIERSTWRANKFLEDSNFFIYAYHSLALSFISKQMLLLLQPQTDWVLTIAYIINPIITVLLGVCIYAVIKKLFPKFTAIITGGR